VLGIRGRANKGVQACLVVCMHVVKLMYQQQLHIYEVFLQGDSTNAPAQTLKLNNAALQPSSPMLSK
jgi:hypothetical protein